MKRRIAIGLLVLTLAGLFYRFAPVVPGEYEEDKYEWHTLSYAVYVHQLFDEAWEDN